MDIITAGFLLNKIKSAATGIDNIYKEDGYIVFVMEDGREFRVEDEKGKEVTDIDVVNGYIKITYDDGSTITSLNPIPYPDVMTGATALADGTSGLTPVPIKGDKRYLASDGTWDDTLIRQVDKINDAIPTDNIPEGATLTADGWSVTTDEEVANEFEQWED